jgi:DNA-binding NarL/FixJ family response regulator
MVATGLTNRQISTRLWISEPTVKTHVSHILEKLGQPDRTQAILHAMSLGIVAPPALDVAEAE